MNKQDLIQFEEEIKELFLDARIRAPVHLSRGNEEPLIEIFKQISNEDWVFSTHRSHYHALLKGIDPEWVRNEILAGRSMHINNIDIYKLKAPKDIVPAYQRALQCDRSSILIEIGDLYKDQ